ncbi:hypothetical protein AWM75_00595 [Aerococcus urinaehominis]|uniref:Uncharacterized protein n=1 Tax=Aerococcus urinaehominis TaxID=128944 RepID=A0A0X8FJQ4_9LACT|nr:creatininase family protein [Aerococcus urinaehominis]AMB98581.1 hypothetical protein AWM75_00595 [Aerococcus urinaehominis]SDL77144.1 creatinine amidohydrolase [Aerococcus urinaehominis]
MELRSHFLNQLTNQEVEDYLDQDDVILVPFGPTEVHGGLPLDCETVVSQGLALLLAQRVNCLVLPNIPYIYSGATASARGTIQLTVKESSNLLYGIAKSLLQSGFTRQIYFSLHGPAHIPMQPVVRDFFDETGVGILYIDIAMALHRSGLFEGPDMLANFDRMILAAYQLQGRLAEVPLTTAFDHEFPNDSGQFSYLKKQAYESGAIGYYFGDLGEHMPTTAIPDEATRQRLAEEGLPMLEKVVDLNDLPRILAEMNIHADYVDRVLSERPNSPAAFNQGQ